MFSGCQVPGGTTGNESLTLGQLAWCTFGWVLSLLPTFR